MVSIALSIMQTVIRGPRNR